MKMIPTLRLYLCIAIVCMKYASTTEKVKPNNEGGIVQNLTNTYSENKELDKDTRAKSLETDNLSNHHESTSVDESEEKGTLSDVKNHDLGGDPMINQNSRRNHSDDTKSRHTGHVTKNSTFHDSLIIEGTVNQTDKKFEDEPEHYENYDTDPEVEAIVDSPNMDINMHDKDTFTDKVSDEVEKGTIRKYVVSELDSDNTTKSNNTKMHNDKESQPGDKHLDMREVFDPGVKVRKIVSPVRHTHPSGLILDKDITVIAETDGDDDDDEEEDAEDKDEDEDNDNGDGNGDKEKTTIPVKNAESEKEVSSQTSSVGDTEESHKETEGNSRKEETKHSKPSIQKATQEEIKNREKHTLAVSDSLQIPGAKAITNAFLMPVVLSPHGVFSTNTQKQNSDGIRNGKDKTAHASFGEDIITPFRLIPPVGMSSNTGSLSTEKKTFDSGASSDINVASTGNTEEGQFFHAFGGKELTDIDKAVLSVVQRHEKQKEQKGFSSLHATPDKVDSDQINTAFVGDNTVVHQNIKNSRLEQVNNWGMSHSPGLESVKNTYAINTQEQAQGESGNSPGMLHGFINPSKDQVSAIVLPHALPVQNFLHTQTQGIDEDKDRDEDETTSDLVIQDSDDKEFSNDENDDKEGNNDQNEHDSVDANNFRHKVVNQAIKESSPGVKTSSVGTSSTHENLHSDLSYRTETKSKINNNPESSNLDQIQAADSDKEGNTSNEKDDDKIDVSMNFVSTDPAITVQKIANNKNHDQQSAGMRMRVNQVSRENPNIIGTVNSNPSNTKNLGNLENVKISINNFLSGDRDQRQSVGVSMFLHPSSGNRFDSDADLQDDEDADVGVDDDDDNDVKDIDSFLNSIQIARPKPESNLSEKKGTDDGAVDLFFNSENTRENHNPESDDDIDETESNNQVFKPWSISTTDKIKEEKDSLSHDEIEEGHNEEFKIKHKEFGQSDTDKDDDVIVHSGTGNDREDNDEEPADFHDIQHVGRTKGQVSENVDQDHTYRLSEQYLQDKRLVRDLYEIFPELYDISQEIDLFGDDEDDRPNTTEMFSDNKNTQTHINSHNFDVAKEEGSGFIGNEMSSKGVSELPKLVSKGSDNKLKEDNDDDTGGDDGDDNSDGHKAFDNDKKNGGESKEDDVFSVPSLEESVNGFDLSSRENKESAIVSTMDDRHGSDEVVHDVPLRDTLDDQSEELEKQSNNDELSENHYSTDNDDIDDDLDKEVNNVQIDIDSAINKQYGESINTLKREIDVDNDDDNDDDNDGDYDAADDNDEDDYKTTVKQNNNADNADDDDDDNDEYSNNNAADNDYNQSIGATNYNVDVGNNDDDDNQVKHNDNDDNEDDDDDNENAAKDDDDDHDDDDDINHKTSAGDYNQHVAVTDDDDNDNDDDDNDDDDDDDDVIKDAVDDYKVDDDDEDGKDNDDKNDNKDDEDVDKDDKDEDRDDHDDDSNDDDAKTKYSNRDENIDDSHDDEESEEFEDTHLSKHASDEINTGSDNGADSGESKSDEIGISEIKQILKDYHDSDEDEQGQKSGEIVDGDSGSEEYEEPDGNTSTEDSESDQASTEKVLHKMEINSDESYSKAKSDVTDSEPESVEFNWESDDEEVHAGSESEANSGESQSEEHRSGTVYSDDKESGESQSHEIYKESESKTGSKESESVENFENPVSNDHSDESTPHGSSYEISSEHHSMEEHIASSEEEYGASESEASSGESASTEVTEKPPAYIHTIKAVEDKATVESVTKPHVVHVYKEPIDEISSYETNEKQTSDESVESTTSFDNLIKKEVTTENIEEILSNGPPFGKFRSDDLDNHFSEEDISVLDTLFNIVTENSTEEFFDVTSSDDKSIMNVLFESPVESKRLESTTSIPNLTTSIPNLDFQNLVTPKQEVQTTPSAILPVAKVYTDDKVEDTSNKGYNPKPKNHQIIAPAMDLPDTKRDKLHYNKASVVKPKNPKAFYPWLYKIINHYKDLKRKQQKPTPTSYDKNPDTTKVHAESINNLRHRIQFNQINSGNNAGFERRRGMQLSGEIADDRNQGGNRNSGFNNNQVQPTFLLSSIQNRRRAAPLHWFHSGNNEESDGEHMFDDMDNFNPRHVRSHASNREQLTPTFIRSSMDNEKRSLLLHRHDVDYDDGFDAQNGAENVHDVPNGYDPARDTNYGINSQKINRIEERAGYGAGGHRGYGSPRHVVNDMREHGDYGIRTNAFNDDWELARQRKLQRLIRKRSRIQRLRKILQNEYARKRLVKFLRSRSFSSGKNSYDKRIVDNVSKPSLRNFLCKHCNLGSKSRNVLLNSHFNDRIFPRMDEMDGHSRYPIKSLGFGPRKIFRRSGYLGLPKKIVPYFPRRPFRHLDSLSEMPLGARISDDQFYAPDIPTPQKLYRPYNSERKHGTFYPPKVRQNVHQRDYLRPNNGFRTHSINFKRDRAPYYETTNVFSDDDQMILNKGYTRKSKRSRKSY